MAEPFRYQTKKVRDSYMEKFILIYYSIPKGLL